MWPGKVGSSMHRIRIALVALAHLGFLAAADPAIVYDGSSTVYPIVVATAERYVEVNPGFQIEARPTGSGAGIRSLLEGTSSISGASRPIHDKELAAAVAAHIDVLELPIAYDGVAVVTNARNTFINALSVAELKRIYAVGGPTTWRQVRPEWPDARIRVFALGQDSGTREFFTDAVLGKDAKLREDATASQDAHVLVQGVSGDVNAIAFFGMSYCFENPQLVRAIPIDNGKGAVALSRQGVLDGTYLPLSRPVFIYLSSARLARADLGGYLGFILDHPEIIEEVGYAALPAPMRQQVKERLAARTVGSLFAGAPAGATLASLMAPPVKPPAPTPVAAAKPVETPKPAWKGPGAMRHQQEVDRLRAAAVDLARRTLDESSTVEELAQRAAELKRQADALAETFHGAPRGTDKGLSLAEAAGLAQ